MWDLILSVLKVVIYMEGFVCIPFIFGSTHHRYAVAEGLVPEQEGPHSIFVLETT